MRCTFSRPICTYLFGDTRTVPVSSHRSPLSVLAIHSSHPAIVVHTVGDVQYHTPRIDSHGTATKRLYKSNHAFPEVSRQDGSYAAIGIRGLNIVQGLCYLVSPMVLGIYIVRLIVLLCSCCQSRRRGVPGTRLGSPDQGGHRETDWRLGIDGVEPNCRRSHQGRQTKLVSGPT